MKSMQGPQHVGVTLSRKNVDEDRVPSHKEQPSLQGKGEESRSVMTEDTVC